VIKAGTCQGIFYKQNETVVLVLVTVIMICCVLLVGLEGSLWSIGKGRDCVVKSYKLNIMTMEAYNDYTSVNIGVVNTDSRVLLERGVGVR